MWTYIKKQRAFLKDFEGETKESYPQLDERRLNYIRKNFGRQIQTQQIIENYKMRKIAIKQTSKSNALSKEVYFSDLKTFINNNITQIYNIILNAQHKKFSVINRYKRAFQRVFTELFRVEENLKQYLSRFNSQIEQQDNLYIFFNGQGQSFRVEDEIFLDIQSLKYKAKQKQVDQDQFSAVKSLDLVELITLDQQLDLVKDIHVILILSKMEEKVQHFYPTIYSYMEKNIYFRRMLGVLKRIDRISEMIEQYIPSDESSEFSEQSEQYFFEDEFNSRLETDCESK